MMKFFLTLFVFTVSFSLLNAQDKEVKFEVSAKKYLMGTEFEITVVHSSIDSGKKAIFFALKEIERIENFASNYKDSTEISFVNRNAFNHPVKVSEELFSLLERSIKYSEKYDGIFDVTVGPLTDYWGFNSDHPIETEPDKKIIDSLLQFVGYKNLKLDHSNLTVSFLKDGMKIDLGGIAKGYSLDKAAEILRSKGIKDFLISGGGDIFSEGYKTGNEKWVIGVKDPRAENSVVKILQLTNLCAATSGDYERYRIINGKRYHHIFNPKTGYPGELCQSSTVICSSGEEGVVLSKICFLLGKENLDKFNLAGSVPCLLVDENHTLWNNNLIQPYFLEINK